MKCILVVLLVTLATITHSIMLRNSDVPPKHIVVDHTSNPTLHHVIRKNPTITVETHMAPIPTHTPADDQMSFGNNNDNNGPDVPNPSYGKAAEIAPPAIYTHSKGTMSVVTEQPAHVGWRSETKTITSLNKNTSKFSFILYVKIRNGKALGTS